MTPKPTSCRAIEADLVATATGEAGATAVKRVTEHARDCAPCRQEMGRYRAIDSVARGLRHETPPADDVAASRTALQARLADLKSRVLRYGIVPSPLGNILVARSEHGVTMVEYLGQAQPLAGPRLRDLTDVDTWRTRGDRAAARRSARVPRRSPRDLGWRLDLDWPAATSVAPSSKRPPASLRRGLVCGHCQALGKPGAERAVAQACAGIRFRSCACHRIVGSSGKLTGYAGDKLGLKRQLLDIEGVHTQPASRDFRVVREAMYVRAGEDRAYCLPTCGDLPSHSLADLTLIASREGVAALGLEPCSDCRPDLHPLAS